jgi:hypothetical protein
MTDGDVEASARLLIDFRGRSSLDVKQGGSVGIGACRTSHSEGVYSAVDGDREFPTCKVCWSADKDTAIEPCGHLICWVCFDRIRQLKTQMSSACPFCRTAIAGARPAVLKGAGLEAVRIPRSVCYGARAGGGGGIFAPPPPPPPSKPQCS